MFNMLGFITRSKVLCGVELLICVVLVVFILTQLTPKTVLHSDSGMQGTDTNISKKLSFFTRRAPQVGGDSQNKKQKAVTTQSGNESVEIKHLGQMPSHSATDRYIVRQNAVRKYSITRLVAQEMPKENAIEAVVNNRSPVEVKANSSMTNVTLSDPQRQQQTSIQNSVRQELVGMSPKTLLVLFSTWSFKKGKEHVRRSILGTWRHWYPEIVPVLFTSSKEAKQEAEGRYWEVMDVGETACNASYMPTLRGMFKDAIYRFNNTTSIFGFANGDILFEDGLKNTINGFVKSEAVILKTRPVLILGKRLNVRVHDSDKEVGITDVKSMASRGHYPGEGSSDFFFTNHLFPWIRVPEMVIARMGFGMWIVAFARANNVTVYDFTKTVTAVHMTTEGGIFESHKSSNSYCNHKLFRKKKLLPKSFDCGWINCSDRRSEYANDGSILFRTVSRTALWPRCNACD